MPRRIVIVGASLAGLRAAEALRSDGFDGEVVLVGAERHLPYDRPPLSKELLLGTTTVDDLRYRPPERFAELDIELRLGVAATELDARDRTLRVGADQIHYDDLVLATGCAARRLPDLEGPAGVHVLRTIDDAVALRTELVAGARLCVVGAGFIGAEVASSARSLGVEVTVLEALPRPLERAVGPHLAEVFAGLHGDGGTTLRCGVSVAGIEGGDRVSGVRLADGTAVPADVVLVGAGAVPATGWLTGSGIELGNGIVCDAALRTSVPRVVAAGDLVEWDNELFGERMRVEHWTNAGEQGAAAAKTLLVGAAAEPYRGVPYFWSEQYGVRIQLAGRPTSADVVDVVAGALADRRFVAVYRRGDRLRAVLAIDMPRPFTRGRAALMRGSSVDDATAAIVAAL